MANYDFLALFVGYYHKLTLTIDKQRIDDREISDNK
jgi:hypothetical protein